MEANSKSLFMEDYVFTGRHEEKARKLTSVIDNASGSTIFNSAIELYLTAAVVGCYFKKRSQKEKGDKTFKIMQGQFSSHYQDLMFVYKLVMLEDDNLSLEPIDKINNAFKYKEQDSNIKSFEEYMLGGIDILYDKFFVSSNSNYDDFLGSLVALVDEFDNSDSKREDPVATEFDEVNF